MKRTTLPVLTVSVAGSKAALLVPSPVIFTSTTAVGVAVAAAGAGAAFAVATAACEASPFFSPPQAATPNTASVLSTVQRIADLLRSLRCELVNAFTIYAPPSKAGAHDPLRFSSLPTTLEPMPAPAFPQMRPEDLALRLDRGERVQLLDIRATERVAQAHVTFGPALDFRAVPASEIYRLSSLEPLHLDRAQPVAVICGHGNSSRQATQYLRDKGFEAFSVTGGMAAWETVHLPRALSPTPTLQHVIQLDRVGKGALSYVLISDGDAVVVDPGRYVERYDELLTVLGATAAAVIDTHMHADYLSGARAGAARWQVPYFLHPDDAGSPYDATPGRLAYQPLSEGDTIAFGRATLRAQHVPGHTLGSVALIADDALALTGDFLFVQSVGRPDLGGQGAAWAELLWKSLERARREWPGELLVLPAHYGSEQERRADRTVAARFDVVAATNEAAAMQDRAAFLRWIADHTTTPPDSYRTIKLANLGLLELSDVDAELVEFGPNQCAI
ncbi:MAG: hypothetical protein DMD47_04720 [Gemmatimonadetes bacterium]|nr:MAG: hypothetical protein DMD47_04720 [Gemmatimonadota bacterium]